MLNTITFEMNCRLHWLPYSSEWKKLWLRHGVTLTTHNRTEAMALYNEVTEHFTSALSRVFKPPVPEASPPLCVESFDATERARLRFEITKYMYLVYF